MSFSKLASEGAAIGMAKAANNYGPMGAVEMADMEGRMRDIVPNRDRLIQRGREIFHGMRAPGVTPDALARMQGEFSDINKMIAEQQGTINSTQHQLNMNKQHEYSLANGGKQLPVIAHDARPSLPERMLAGEGGFNGRFGDNAVRMQQAPGHETMSNYAREIGMPQAGAAARKGLPMWGKVGLGVGGAALGAMALNSLLSPSKPEPQHRPMMAYA
jgi:hypothetical protein